MNEELTAFELAILIDLYGEETVDEMLANGELPDVVNSRTYKAEFEQWVEHMEEDLAKNAKSNCDGIEL